MIRTRNEMQRKEGLRVAILDTAMSDIGSMREYATVVQRALEEYSPEGIHVETCRVGLPPEIARVIPSQLRTWANHIHVSASVRSLNTQAIDVLHVVDGSFAYLVDGEQNVPFVITAHDAIPALRAAGQFGKSTGSRLAKWLIRRSASGYRSAQSVLSVSQKTASDITATTGLDRARIRVVPWALPFKAQTLLAEDTRPWDERRLEAPYVLHVGNNGFYKNRHGVVRIFAKMPEVRGLHLLMAGPPPPRGLINLVRTLGVGDRVEFVTDPADEDLCDLYRDASLFLFPSVYEGFGLPPLEAMAAGCPVVCSSEGALAEVVGNAAITSLPQNEQELADAAYLVLSSPEVAERLQSDGRRWAAKYSLDQMGRGLVASYREAIERT